VGATLTQLAYYRLDPRERCSLVPSLLACSIFTILLGLFNAWVALHGIRGIPVNRNLLHFWLSDAIAILWATAFLVVGFAISRACRWTRAALLGLVPAFLIGHISQAITDVWFRQSFMTFHRGFLADLVELTQLASTIPLFIWLCFPQVDRAFAASGAKLSEPSAIPTLLVAYVVACASLGVHQLVLPVGFLLALGAAHTGILIHYSIVSSVLIIGGILCIWYQRVAVLATVFILIEDAFWQAAPLFAQVLHPQPNQAPTGLWNLDLVVAGTKTTLLLLGALTGALIVIFPTRGPRLVPNANGESPSPATASQRIRRNP
jgi:hypothetical protein